MIPAKPHLTPSTNNYAIMDSSLNFYNKSNNPTIFKKLLQKKITSFAPDIIIYTDGYFRQGTTTYGIVEQKSPTRFDTIFEERLPDNAGIFSAELAAIKAAILYVGGRATRALICTDSLSAVNALFKNKTGTYNHIIALPSPNQEVLILWVPSHIGIKGNECADAAAKRAQDLLNVTEVPCFPHIIFNQYEASRRQLHTPLLRPNYNINMTRSDCIMLGRLRVGKTKFNTQHYYNGANQAKCSFCNVILSVEHILTECVVSKINESLDKIIDCATDKFLPSIKNSLRKHNIQDV